MQKFKKLLVLICFGLVILSCHKSRKNANNAILVKNAASFIGTPYKFGGTDQNGLDCSGLLYLTFQKQHIQIPRISYQQAEVFNEIQLANTKIGDLVFFKVNSHKINHTGIISKILSRSDIKFIHASTSKGVVEDNLLSNYWKNKIAKITRPVF